ncbi:MAG: energy transducer TonB [Ignavibacteriae bacterium]|nr:MAG: energy transducer TonB [Ignavibacteriota bacterium]
MVPLIGLPVSRLCLLACVIIFCNASLTPACDVKLNNHACINTSVTDSTDKDAMDESDVDSPPECLNLSEVQDSFVYPDSARKMGVEGKIMVRILVDKLGFVRKIGDMTGPEIFYDEVRKKVVKLKFAPGIYEGRIVKVWVKVPLYFKLQR